ncbi:hypothetical protein EST38_g7325 [Candolleomyces aberdarensis]|uniref:RxLR effector protein n=1 Tax=Candolleomyces aberdarensis TaxID=2316362 RepID=A0A4Q2DIB0_9AGAR|nr:hypothetical protein EST38_g7325 [Candolleomyces aberdarensis]
MVRIALFSIAVTSTFIAAAVAHPIDSFSQEDNVERGFVGSFDDLDLVSRADMGVDLVESLAVREPFFVDLIKNTVKAIKASIAARKAKKEAQKAAGGAPPPKQKAKKGKREFLDEDTEYSDLFRREVVEELIRRYLEDNLESSFDRRDLVESLEALD